MGCSQFSRNNRILKSIIKSKGQKTFYSKLNHPEFQIIGNQYITIEFQSQAYLLYWDDSKLNIFGLETCQNQEFIFEGKIQNVTEQNKCILIITDQYLYRLQMVDDRIKIVKRIRFRLGKQNNNVNVQILFYSQNLILVKSWNYFYMLKLGEFRMFKIIFKILCSPFNNFNYQYDKEKKVIIFSDDNSVLKILDIQSKIYKQVQLCCPYKLNWTYIKYVKIIENKIDVIFESNGQIFLNKINHQNGRIETIKLLFYGVGCDLYEENNELILQTSQVQLKLNKEYHILQKIERNFQQLKINYYDLVLQTANEITKYSKQYLFFKVAFFNSQIIRKNCEGEYYIQIYYQNQLLKTGQIWIREVNDYKIEENTLKAKISQNQLYLVILRFSSLSLSIIESKREMQYFFQEHRVGNLALSKYLNQLCITRIGHIFYFQCQSNLKQKFQLFIQYSDKVIIGRNGIDIMQNSKDRIKVISQKAKKIIFTLKYKFNGGYYGNNILDYCPFSGIIMIFRQEIQLTFIYQLHDRKKIMLNIEKKHCKLVPKTKQLIILRRSGQLELQTYNNQWSILSQRLILENIDYFIDGQSNAFYVISYNNKILVLNQKLKLTEEIEYDHLDFNPVQIMEKYILCKNENGIQLIRRT